MNEEHLAKYGVKKLSETPAGRSYLNELRTKKYKYETLQPNDPLFHKVYSSDLSRKMALKEQEEIKAKDAWAEINERKRWEREQKERKRIVIK